MYSLQSVISQIITLLISPNNLLKKYMRNKEKKKKRKKEKKQKRKKEKKKKRKKERKENVSILFQGHPELEQEHLYSTSTVE